LFYTVKHEFSGHFFVETLGGPSCRLFFVLCVCVKWYFSRGGCTLKIVVVFLGARQYVYIYG